MAQTGVTVDIGSFTEDFPTDIRRRVYDHYRTTGNHPKYILLGRKEHRYLTMEFTRDPYFMVYAIDLATRRETFCGVEILKVDRESFVDVV